MGEIKFVVIDDAVFMRTLIKRMIEENSNYIVVGEGSNGYEAIELARKYQPDIITLDITMPEMDGIMAIRGIKEVSPESKILMVSAMGQQGMVIDAIKMGAKDFVVKPFDKSRVQQAIENVLKL
jgi:two-component system chemotaxis response regulator CheY